MTLLRRMDDISETEKLIYAMTTVRLEKLINGEWKIQFRLREASHPSHNPMLYSVATYTPDMQSFDDGITFKFVGKKKTREFIKERYDFDIPEDAFEWFRSVDICKRMIKG